MKNPKRMFPNRHQEDAAMKDLLSRAAEEAARNPVPRLPRAGDAYRGVAGIAATPHRLTAGDSFILPRDQVAALLDISPYGVSKVIRELESDKVLLCVDHRHQPGKLCKKYAWTYEPDPRPATPWGYRSILGATVVVEGGEGLSDVGLRRVLHEALTSLGPPIRPSDWMTDAEIVTSAARGAQGDEFRRLWSGL